MLKRKIGKIYKLYKKNGVGKTLQYLFRRCTGMQKQQEEIDTMFYFLNHFYNIQDLPPTKDEDLRILQKCDAEFLKIFDIVCKRHKITYWLDYGTLLGAVRHKGFIPWDDDMDLGICRADFDRFIKEVGPDFEKLNIDVTIESRRIGLGYRHRETGIWIDLFPVDDYFTNNCFEDEKIVLERKIKKYQRKYDLKPIMPKEQYVKQRRETIGNTDGQGHRLIYHNPEFKYIKPVIHDDKDIFPLSVIEFEGYEFPAPNNCDAYLKCIYGSHYMEFPHNGVEHHGGDDGLLKTWAKKAGIDMNEVLKELQSIYRNLEK